MKQIFLLLIIALLAAPIGVSGQTVEPVAEDTYYPVPWTRAISIGATIWPTSKEKLRLGYHWQPAPNKEWVHELAFIEATRIRWGESFDTDRIGDLRGWQLKNELRFYHNKKEEGPAYWYHGLGLAYMYTSHSLTKGMECEDWSGCAYFRRFGDVKAHTNTLTGNFGLMLRTGGIVNFNFYSNLGLRGSYFPKASSPDYFGRGPLLINREHFLLLPYVKLGVNMTFIVSKRKH